MRRLASKEKSRWTISFESRNDSRKGNRSCVLKIWEMRLRSFRILCTSFEKLSSYAAMVFRMSSQYGADGSDNTKRSYKQSYTTQTDVNAESADTPDRILTSAPIMVLYV